MIYIHIFDDWDEGKRECREFPLFRRVMAAIILHEALHWVDTNFRRVGGKVK